MAEQTDGADQTSVTSERRATTRKSTATRKTAPARKRASAEAVGAKTSEASPGTRGRAQEQKGSPDRGGQMKGDSSVKRDGVEKTQPARKRTSTRRSTAEGTSSGQAPTKRATTKRASSRQTAAEQAAGADATSQVAPTQAEQRPNAATDLAESARLLVVRPEEEPWTPEELAEVYHELADDVSRLKAELHSATDELADLLRDSGDGAGDDQADAGSKTFEREHEMSLANNTREMLEQTERAVARIRNGTYGVCEGCANPIGKARLLAFPRATLCVSCKQKEERR